MPVVEGADGTVPQALLESDVVAAPDPPAAYLLDGEQAHHAAVLSKITGKIKASAGSGSEALALLTDRRVLLFRGDDESPKSIPYQDLEPSGTSALATSDLKLTRHGGTYKLHFRTPPTNFEPEASLETHAGQPAVADLVDFLETRAAMAAEAASEVERLEKRADQRVASASGPSGGDPVAAITDLMAARDMLLEARDAARRFYRRTDPSDLAAQAEELERRAVSRYEEWVSAAENALTEGRYEHALETATAAADELHTVPASPEEVDELRTRLLRTQLRAQLHVGPPEDGATLVAHGLRGAIQAPDDAAPVLADVLTNHARSDARTVRAVVATLVPRLARSRSMELARFLIDLLEQDPELFAAVGRVDCTGLVGESEPAVRELGCRLLERTGTADELEALRAVTDDESYDVRVAALRAMRAISEREGVPLEEADKEQMRTVNVEYHGEGDVITGAYTDASTTVEDSVVNRSTVGDGDVDGADGAVQEADRDEDGPRSDEFPDFCPSCGSALEEYASPAFCPSCGFDL